MSATKLADEYDAIRQRLAEIERDKTAALNAEQPKVQPDYSGLYGLGGYHADDYDPA